jgi:hypothetical protein
MDLAMEVLAITMTFLFFSVGGPSLLPGLVFKTVAGMMAPCSANTIGSYRRPPWLDWEYDQD